VVTALSVEGLHRRGWEVAVISPRYPADASDVFRDVAHEGSRSLSVRVRSVPMPGYPEIRVAAPCRTAVRSLIQRFRPDVVHSATEFMIGWTGQREAARHGLPAVSSYHTDFSRYTEAYGVPRLRPAVQRYLARFHRRSARVYTPGMVARDELAALGVSRVEVWGRGVDLVQFNEAQRNPATVRLPGVDPEAFVFLHVGRLAAEKGVDRILDAYRLASSSLAGRRPVHLIVAGDGPVLPALRGAAPAGVTFLGNLDRLKALPALYASADAFLFASHTETLGLVILEAMASGLPVIAAPAGGVADHLRHEENGLAYPPGDVTAMAEAIERLATNPALRTRLAQGARRTAEALSWESELDRLAASYGEVIRGD
jgi:glycosyltransferase involved in cell wall biosynthesis